MSDWQSLPMLYAEVKQRKEEGFPVHDLELRIAELGQMPILSEVYQLWAELEAGEPSVYFGYREPLDLDSIRCERPYGPRQLSVSLSGPELAERIHGAWLGMAIGTTLGRPVEGWSRDRIRSLLERVNAYPLTDYFPWIDNPPITADYRDRPKAWFKGHLRQAARDDGIDHHVMAILVMESRGLDFRSKNIAGAWLRSLPYDRLRGAERAAYRNIVGGLMPPVSAAFRNPFRESAGALHRSTIWGQVAPGNPELAAELAFRDASVSHTKNGVYAAMLVAAMTAAAFATSDLEEIVQIGLGEIPVKSRLAEAIRNVLKWSRDEPNWERTIDRIGSEYGRYDAANCIPNTAIALTAFLTSGLELEFAICQAGVSGGSTAGNAGVAGSLVGALVGASSLPAKLVQPLRDSLDSLVHGAAESGISGLATRTYGIACGATP